MWRGTLTSGGLQTVILWLFHLLLFVTPFLFSFSTSELFEFNKMVFVYTMTVLIAGCWVARSILEKKVLLKNTPFDWLVLIFVGSQILSTLASIELRTSLFGYYSRFNGGLFSILSYSVLLFIFASTVAKKQLKGFVVTLLLSGSLVALYAIPERFFVSPSCWLLTQQLTTDCWSEATNPKYRVFGTFGQPNWLAAYSSMLIPLALWLVTQVQARKQLSIVIGSTSGLLLFLALLFTKSRSGLLGFAVAMTFLVGFVLWKQWQKKQLDFKSLWSLVDSGVSGGKALVVVVTLFIGMATWFGTPFTQSATELLKLGAPKTEQPAPVDRLEAGGTDSGEIRQIVWSGALKVWQRYPLLGSGLETFGYSYYLDRPVQHNTVSEWDFLYNKAHNEFLNYLATTGIVGLASYLLLLGGVCFACLKTKESGLSTALLAGITALSVSNFFGFSTVTVNLLLFIFIAMAAVIEQKKDQELTSRATVFAWSKNTNTTQKLGLLATVAITLVLLQRIQNYWQADVLFAMGSKHSQAGLVATGIEALTQAIERSPAEAGFYDELGQAYTSAAVAMLQAGDATTAAQLAQNALTSNTTALQLNPRQLNYYKSYAQTLIRLSQLDPTLLEDAKTVLKSARLLAPTDARLVYNLALVEEALGNSDTSKELLVKALKLKPNYEQVRLKLESYQEQNPE